jgi:hypothetical protein
MLLAEALDERADAQRRLSDLRYRIGENARVQEGTRPAEDPQVLLNRAMDVSERIRALAVAIDVTNVASTLPDGTTVTEVLARLEALDRQIRVLTETADRATDRVARRSRSEIRELAMFDVGGLRDDADRLAVERRELGAALQLVNWTTALHVPV